MIYEVIKDIKNSCSNNQMRDIFIREEDISDPDAWIRAAEPKASQILRENTPGGVRFHVTVAGMTTVYTLTEAE